ncbi:hypothetical protein LN451_02675, partial [Xanthomonas hortorum pv. gardneri]
QAAPALADLLTLLPAVHTIVLVGKKAMLAREAVTRLAQTTVIHSMLHPSPMFVNRARGNRKLLLDQLAVVAAGIHAKS